MNKWFWPVALFGLSSLGVLFLSDRGRDVIRWAADRLENAPDHFMSWNEAAQEELDRIQLALNRMAESLQTAH